MQGFVPNIGRTQYKDGESYQQEPATNSKKARTFQIAEPTTQHLWKNS